MDNYGTMTSCLPVFLMLWSPCCSLLPSIHCFPLAVAAGVCVVRGGEYMYSQEGGSHVGAEINEFLRKALQHCQTIFCQIAFCGH